MKLSNKQRLTKKSIYRIYPTKKGIEHKDFKSNETEYQQSIPTDESLSWLLGFSLFLIWLL